MKNDNILTTARQKREPKRPLVSFSSSYYEYPTSICRGYWGRYALDIDLSAEACKRRNEWLDNVRKLSVTSFNKHVLSMYGEEADYSMFLNILQRHGIFIEKFFHRSVRNRVLGEIIVDPNEIGNLKTLMEAAWGYKTALGRKVSDDVFFVVDHMFEQYLLRTINDKDAYSLLEEWYRRHCLPRECSVCGSTYRIVDIPDWLYDGSNGVHVCCMQCNIIEKPSKIALLSHLQDFVNACGFIPPANASPLNYSFTCRLLPEQWPSVFAAYGKMGGIDHVKSNWNSWFTALASSGVLPDGVLTTSRGIKCLAKDGHECHSLDEQQIDDWLAGHNLPHDREPVYPVHPHFNPSGKRRSDWLVGDVYIEYFGLTGDKTYDKKTDEKIMLAKHLGLKLVPIYPADMMSLDKTLRNLLE